MNLEYIRRPVTDFPFGLWNFWWPRKKENFTFADASNPASKQITTRPAVKDESFHRVQGIVKNESPKLQFLAMTL